LLSRLPARRNNHLPPRRPSSKKHEAFASVVLHEFATQFPLAPMAHVSWQLTDTRNFFSMSSSCRSSTGSPPKHNRILSPKRKPLRLGPIFGKIPGCSLSRTRGYPDPLNWWKHFSFVEPDALRPKDQVRGNKPRVVHDFSNTEDFVRHDHSSTYDFRDGAKSRRAFAKSTLKLLEQQLFKATSISIAENRYQVGPSDSPCIQTVDDLLAGLQTKYLFYALK